MSLFGSLMADVEDDPFFGSHMRHMRQMNSMMNSLLSDPFGMFGGGGPLAIGGPHHGTSLMPFMPQMPSMNRYFPAADLGGGHMNSGSSYSSSTFVMSSGLNGSPQVISSTSSTKIGPHGIKETRKTLQDSRTGTKKMSIGHHIGERGHVIEREQNVYSGDREDHQEFINLEEDEAEDFDREFQEKSGGYVTPSRARITDVSHRSPPRLAIMPAPAATATATATVTAAAPVSVNANESPRRAHSRPSTRRQLRPASSPLALHSSSATVREVYGGSHPQRHRHKHRPRRQSPSQPAHH